MAPTWSSRQPALEFERRHGLSGIAGHYHFPSEPGFDRVSLQASLNRLWSFVGSQAFEELLRQRVGEYAAIVGDPSLTLDRIRADESLSANFNTWTDRQRYHELLDMFTKLAAVNPRQFADIACDRKDANELYSAVHGVVSGFSPGDINYYIHEYLTGSEREIERAKLERIILSNLGNNDDQTLGWIASPYTLETIRRELMAKGVNEVDPSMEAAPPQRE